MRSILYLIIAASLACSQSATAQSKNTPAEGGGASTNLSPAAAYAQLYSTTKQIVSSPSSGYVPPKIDDWPKVTYAQRNWDNAIAARGNTLSPAMKKQLVDNAAHCNNAIADVESGWRIHLTEKTSAAQGRAKVLIAMGREEFAECTVIRPDGKGMPPPVFPDPPK